MQTSTRLIPLTQGQFAIVDEIDYDWLMQWKWNAHKHKNTYGDTFYAARKGPQPKGTPIFMHREIGKRAVGESQMFDHCDRNSLNNTRENIRPCNHTQNGYNRRKSLGSSSRYKGVCWRKQYLKWESSIQVNGRRFYLGRFETEQEAAGAYESAARKFHGEFAFPSSL